MEHLGRRRLIDFAVGAKNFKPPFLPGQPRDDASLNGRKVGIDQHIAGGRHKGCADKLRQSIVDTAVHHPQTVYIAVFHELTRRGQGMGICAGEILYLHQTARPAPGAVGTVELEQATDTTIIRYAGFQRIIFLVLVLPSSCRISSIRCTLAGCGCFSIVATVSLVTLVISASLSVASVSH